MGLDTVYVKKTGSDANPGSDSLPKLTIAGGLGVLNGAGTLNVGVGTYAEHIAGSQVPSGSDDIHRTIIQSLPGQIATIRPSTSDHVIDFDSYAVIFAWFKNLILDGGGQISSGDIAKLVGSGVHHIRFTSCEAKNAWDQGYLIGEATHHNEIIGGSIHDGGRVGTPVNQSHGVYIIGNSNLVDGVEIYSNLSYGVQHFHSGAPFPSGNTIRNCFIHHQIHRHGINDYGSNQLVYNNRIWKNGAGSGIGGGIDAPTGSNGKYFNNAIIENYGVGIETNASGEVRNNIIYQNTGSSLIGSPTQSNNLIGVDPRFIDQAAGDFRLNPDSPCRDAAMDLSFYFKTDCVGNQRI